jgi:uncharacterized protein YceH (UPF0502 family)
LSRPARYDLRVELQLTEVEARVLGALVEKDITTPDYYPLSLNALVNACNQKSNREPVMDLEEDAVRAALSSLEEKHLAGPSSSADSRVAKYEHHLQEVVNFNRRETALLCVLLLRGPQTPGELRSRSERMHQFEDLSEVQSSLQRLMDREPPLVKQLPRQSGAREPRYAHLLSGEVATWIASPAAEREPDTDRMTRLEQIIEQLQDEVAGLKQELANFRKQFE